MEINERDKVKMEEEQAENINIAENQNDTNVMDSEDNQGEKAQVMTAPCTDPQTNHNKPKRNARRHLGLAPLGGDWEPLSKPQKKA